MVAKTVHGTVRGRTIELDQDLGVSEGQEVELQVKLVERAPLPWGDGLRRSAGALADDPHWDRIMDQIHQARKRERRPQFEP
jgi:hypothetical protein